MSCELGRLDLCDYLTFSKTQVEAALVHGEHNEPDVEYCRFL